MAIATRLFKLQSYIFFYGSQVDDGVRSASIFGRLLQDSHSGTGNGKKEGKNQGREVGLEFQGEQIARGT
jgi:hypothetical protein